MVTFNSGVGQVNDGDNSFKAGYRKDYTLAPGTGTEKITLPGEPAGFWIRIAACGLDCFLVAFTLLVVTLIIHQADIGKAATAATSWLFQCIVLYNWLWIGLKGQTPGKKLFLIKVAGVDNNEIGMGRALLRELLGKPITLAFIVFYVAYSLTVSSGSGPKSFSLHDKIARSKVVVTKRYSALKTSGAWWLLEFLPVLGSITGLLLLKKDSRKAWAIFWGGLFIDIFLVPIAIVIVGLVVS